MVDLPAKFDLGGLEQFYLVTSVAQDQAPCHFILDGEGTLVSSKTATASGANADNYYAFQTVPSSVGLYTEHWHYVINGNSFEERNLFEVVQTLAYPSTGQYCTFVDVVNLYEPMKDYDLRYHEIDEKIQDAMARIDARLGVRYAVPFETGVNSLPPVVKSMTKSLTLVDIMRQRGTSSPDWIDELKAEVNSMLGAIADGDMTLVLPGGEIMAEAVPSGMGQVLHSMGDYSPTFNMLDWQDQRVDPDLQEDQEDAL